MLRKWQFWFLTGISVLTLALVMTNMWLFLGNRSLQLEINTRQQYVQQSIQLEGLGREIVKALAELSVKNQDEELRRLLASQGITFTVNQPVANLPAKGESEAPKKDSR